MATQIISKKCTRCKEIKPLSEFYKNRSQKDSHHYCCKICNQIYHRSKKGKIAQKHYDQSEKGKIKRKRYTQSKKGKQMFKRYCIKNPEKRQAKIIVNNTIALGKIQPAKNYNCKCGNQAEQYHHPDYSKPFDIVPVCKKCHRKVHKKTA